MEQRRRQSIYQQTGTADRRRQLQDVLLGSGVRLLNDHKAKMLQHPVHLHHPMCSYSLKEIADCRHVNYHDRAALLCQTRIGSRQKDQCNPGYGEH
jgi:hypothetical protein